MSRRRRFKKPSTRADRDQGTTTVQHTRDRAPRTHLLELCFFVGGATSLALEVAWSKQLAFILGSSLYAIATVVSAFMCGLALGSGLAGIVGRRVERPYRFYALLQAVIALSGAVSIPVFRSLEPVLAGLYRLLETGGSLLLLARFALVFGVMLLPVTLMGLTLPWVIGIVGREREDYSRVAGHLYAINTLGAVIGTLGAGFLLIPVLGLLRTCLVVALLDAGVAGLAFYLDRRSTSTLPANETTRKTVPIHGRQILLALAFALSGLLAMILEVGWFRLLVLTIGPSVQAFTAMLALFLVGISGGSALGARYSPSSGTAIGRVSALAAALGLIVLAELQILSSLPNHYAALFDLLPMGLGIGRMIVSQLVLSAAVVLLPCLLMGAQFPAFIQAFRELGQRRSIEEEVGRLYMMNTLGGVAGTLLAGFVLLPNIGVWQVLIAVAVCSVLLAGVLPWLQPELIDYRRAVAVLVSAVALMVMAPDWEKKLYNQGRYRAVHGEGPWSQGDPTLLFHREGVNASVAVFNFEGVAALNVSGKTDASTGAVDLITQRLVGHIPALLHPRPSQVAIIGFGSGMTAGAILRHQAVESLLVAELEQGVVDASQYFRYLNGSPELDSRTRMVVEDGRSFFQQSQETFDLVISQPSNPWIAGVGNLFTEDFYRLVARRLKRGGLFAQWMQTYETSEIPFAVVLATLRKVFPHMVLFRMGPGDELFVASQTPIAIPWTELASRASEPGVAQSLSQVDIREPGQLLYHLRGRSERFASFYEKAPLIHRDDNLWLEYHMPYEILKRGEHSLLTELNQRTADHLPAEMAAVFPGIPVAEALEAMVDHEYAVEPRSGRRPVRDPQDPDLSMHPVRIKKSLRDLGEVDLARSMGRWIDRGRARHEARQQIAELLSQEIVSGRFPDRDLVRKAWQQAPELPLSKLSAARLLLNEGHYDSARDMVASIPSSSPMRYLALVNLAQGAAALAEAGAPKMGEEAVDLYTYAIQQNPYRLTAFEELASFLAKSGQTDLARETLDLARVFHPEALDLLTFINKE